MFCIELMITKCYQLITYWPNMATLKLHLYFPGWVGGGGWGWGWVVIIKLKANLSSNWTELVLNLNWAWQNEETKLSDSYDNICPAGSGHENTKSCKNKPNDNFHKWVSSRPPSVGDRVNVVLPPHRSGGKVVPAKTKLAASDNTNIFRFFDIFFKY